MCRRRKTKRTSRIQRELHRHGGPMQGHGWAANRASKMHTRRHKHVSSLGGRRSGRRS